MLKGRGSLINSKITIFDNIVRYFQYFYKIKLNP